MRRRLALFLAFSALLAFALVWRSTLGGHVFAPLPLLKTMSPWAEMGLPVDDAYWDVLNWDSLAQFYHWRDISNEQIRSLQAPLWNPYALCGAPLLANGQSAPFYPPNLMSAPLSAARATGWLAWFALFWACLGGCLLFARQGLSTTASMVGGAVWCLSAFFVAWLQLPSVTAVLSCIPWALVACHRLVDDPRTGAAWLALAAAMILLAGHLQFAFYGLALTVAYALFLSIQRRAWVSLGVLPIALMLGAAISALQLLPMLELIGFSHRGATIPTAEGYQAYSRLAMPLYHLISYVSPEPFGHPRDGDYWGAYHYAELALFIGLPTLFLASAALVSRRTPAVWFWLAAWVVAIMIAMGTGLTQALYFYLPGWSGSGSPARVLCIAALALAGLAAHGAQALRDRPTRWPHATGLFLSIVAAFALIGFGLLPQGTSFDLSKIIHIPSLAALIVLIAASILKQPKIVLAATVIALFIPAYRYNLTGPIEAAFPKPYNVPTLQPGERIIGINNSWSLREAPRGQLPPNTAAAWRTPDATGYDSTLLRWYKRMADWMNEQDSAPVENGNMIFAKVMRERWSWLRVKREFNMGIWYELSANGYGLFVGPAEFADEEETWRRLDDAWGRKTILLTGDGAQEALNRYGAGDPQPGEARITEYGPNEIAIAASNPSSLGSWLFISDTYYPGWRATVNGKNMPVIRANGAFRAIPVPPGDSTVRMRYSPASFQWGLILATLGIAIVGVLLTRKRAARVKAEAALGTS
ncbi:MAG: YfhO family protein [Armatimonadetes bacterium]|nr:YfhO family protein [Armatimonadota bacterium]